MRFTSLAILALASISKAVYAQEAPSAAPEAPSAAPEAPSAAPEAAPSVAPDTPNTSSSSLFDIHNFFNWDCKHKHSSLYKCDVNRNCKDFFRCNNNKKCITFIETCQLKGNCVKSFATDFFEVCKKRSCIYKKEKQQLQAVVVTKVKTVYPDPVYLTKTQTYVPDPETFTKCRTVFPKPTYITKTSVYVPKPTTFTKIETVIPKPTVVTETKVHTHRARTLIKVETVKPEPTLVTKTHTIYTKAKATVDPVVPKVVIEKPNKCGTNYGMLRFINWDCKHNVKSVFQCDKKRNCRDFFKCRGNKECTTFIETCHKKHNCVKKLNVNFFSVCSKKTCSFASSCF